MIRYYPAFPDVWDLIHQWMAWLGVKDDDAIVIVAHNSPFDRRVLSQALGRMEQAIPARWIFQDSIKILKETFPGLPSYSLHNLAHVLDPKSKPTHNAESDVRCLFELLQMCFGQTLEDVAVGVIDFMFK